MYIFLAKFKHVASVNISLFTGGFCLGLHYKTVNKGAIKLGNAMTAQP
jgi:hypothetical protein